MDYIALDFETANSQKGGAASLGLAKFDEEGNVINKELKNTAIRIIFLSTKGAVEGGATN